MKGYKIRGKESKKNLLAKDTFSTVSYEPANGRLLHRNLNDLHKPLCISAHQCEMASCLLGLLSS